MITLKIKERKKERKKEKRSRQKKWTEEVREERRKSTERCMSLFYDLQQMDHEGWGPAECPSSCDLSLGSQKFNLTKLLYLMF